MENNGKFSVIGFNISLEHVHIFMATTALVIAYILRVNLSVAIVAMIDSNSTNNPDVPVSFKFVILFSLHFGSAFIIEGKVKNGLADNLLSKLT